MKTNWVGMSLLLVMMVAGPLCADSVYSWTDENGIRHYSNTGIPDGVQGANERPEEFSAAPTPEPNESPGNGGASESPPDTWSGDTPEEKEAAAESNQQMDEQLAAKVEKERQRLGAEIRTNPGSVHRRILYAWHEGRYGQTSRGAAGAAQCRSQALFPDETRRCLR